MGVEPHKSRSRYSKIWRKKLCHVTYRELRLWNLHRDFTHDFFVHIIDGYCTISLLCSYDCLLCLSSSVCYICRSQCVFLFAVKRAEESLLEFCFKKTPKACEFVSTAIEILICHLSSLEIAHILIGLSKCCRLRTEKARVASRKQVRRFTPCP